jgi:[ribosomal protein S18]-alanine N-acetyltransferase
LGHEKIRKELSQTGIWLNVSKPRRKGERTCEQVEIVLATEDLLIRDCKASDLKDIQPIENASFLEDPYSQIVFWSLFLSSKRIFRIGTFGRKIIGYSIVKIESGDQNETISHLVSLAVDPAARKRGVGSKMLEDAILQTRERFPNSKTMVLEVRADNKAAIDLYTKFRFRKMGTISNYYGGGRDALSMELGYESKR